MPHGRDRYRGKTGWIPGVCGSKISCGQHSGNPLEAVTAAKQRTISKVASYYCLTHGYGTSTPCRFDVTAVLGEQIKVIQNAFDYQGF